MLQVYKKALSAATDDGYTRKTALVCTDSPLLVVDSLHSLVWLIVSMLFETMIHMLHEWPCVSAMPTLTFELHWFFSHHMVLRSILLTIFYAQYYASVICRVLLLPIKLPLSSRQPSCLLLDRSFFLGFFVAHLSIATLASLLLLFSWPRCSVGILPVGTHSIIHLTGFPDMCLQQMQTVQVGHYAMAGSWLWWKFPPGFGALLEVDSMVFSFNWSTH